MSHDPSFEERLAQLNARSRVKATPAVHPVPESGGRSRTFAIFGLVSGVLLILAAAGLALWPRGENPMGAYASAYLADAPVPGVGMPLAKAGNGASANPYQLSCLRYLPEAPEGWVRVNSWDARYPELMPKLEAIWQASGRSLQTAPGRPQLETFVRQYAAPAPAPGLDLANQTLGSAMYLNIGAGQFMQASLFYTPRGGTPDCAGAFAETWLEAHESFANSPKSAPLRSGWPLFTYFGKGNTSFMDDRLLSLVEGRILAESETPVRALDWFDVAKHLYGKYAIRQTYLRTTLALVIDGNIEQPDIGVIFADTGTEAIARAATRAFGRP